METVSAPLTQKRLFSLWIPLAIMWIVMAVEQPAVTAVISRLSNPTIELAAFGYAYSLALFIEGPIVQMLSAATALARDRQSYQRLLSIMHVLGAMITIVHIILCIPSVFNWFSGTLMGLPEEIIGPSYRSFAMMIPWSAAVGYRRLWQGVLIRYNRTKGVPIIMYIRLGVAAVVLLTGLLVKSMPGGVIGGLSLTIGVTAGMIAAWYFAQPVIRDLMPEGDPNGESPPMPFAEIVRFYFPLALTSLITLGARPLHSFGIARGLFPLESLALWPVTLGFMFIFTSISLSLQEIVIAQQKDHDTLKVISSFVMRVALVLTAACLVIGLTPAKEFWFVLISGIPEELMRFIPLTLACLAITPFCYAIVSYCRGLLVIHHRTSVITTGVVLNVVTMMSLLVTLTNGLHLTGIYAAAVSFAISYIIESLFLFLKTRSIRRG